MILNVSYNNKEVIQKINSELGNPFPLMERIKMGGIGSPRLNMVGMSIQIHNLMVLDNNRNVCNIEMRPKGIIIGFRSLLESYALIIPFYKLTLYKGNANEYSLYRDDYFVKIEAKSKDKGIHRFMKKIMEAKTNFLAPRIEDL